MRANSMNARSLPPISAIFTIATALMLLIGCSTGANKSKTSTAASTTPPRRFNVVVATNDTPLPPPWQMPTAHQQQQNNAFQTSNQPTPAPIPASLPRTRVLPLTARIASVNDKLRFVVVDFTNSRQPQIDERLSVYRVGEKVAEIKISGPYRNTTVAADIMAGEVKYGDEVKTD
jgi:hypothetical protein